MIYRCPYCKSRYWMAASVERCRATHVGAIEDAYNRQFGSSDTGPGYIHYDFGAPVISDCTQAEASTDCGGSSTDCGSNDCGSSD